MRLLIVIAAAAFVTGCASAPVRDPAVVSMNGEFRGPVVAQSSAPLSARYIGMCESPARRWDRGGYRTYDCKPASGSAVVRAKY
jgi:hypothetical protein